MKYWLMKSEPETYSFDDLKSQTNKVDHWDGVRNYQARNFMKSMKKGDLAFFYHSNTKVPGIVGVVSVFREAYPDFTAFDKKSAYYDPKSSSDNPRWYMVDVKYKRKLKRLVSLEELKKLKSLQDFPLTRKGNRLSIMELSKKQWDIVIEQEES